MHVTGLTVTIIDSFFVPVDFFREATPESITGYEVKRQEEGWIYFDRNGYLLKDSRRKRRGVEISFVFVESGAGGTASVSSSTAKKAYGKVGAKPSPVKKSPPRVSATKPTSATVKSPTTTQGVRTSTASASASSAARTQPRRSVPRAEYKPRLIDSETQKKIDDDLRKLCGDINEQSRSHVNHLDRHVDGLKEVSRQVDATIDEIEQTRQKDIKNVRLSTIETLNGLVHKSDALNQLQDANAKLTEKQNAFFQSEHNLNNLRHGNSLLNAILGKGTDLNGDREQLYSKFNEILSKDLEDQRAECLKILQETEDESKEVYKSSEIDRILSDIAHAIKTTAVDEIRKRENLQDKYQRELTRANDQKDELLSKIKVADDNIRGLSDHVAKQKKDVEGKEGQLADIRQNIMKERQGLVQDENRNSDLEKKLQEMKNRLRFYEQEKLYLLTEKNIASTKLNIEEQLLGERDKAMVDWMRDRIKDEKDKKAALEEKMNQCYSFETKDIIDLFKKEKKLQGDQRQEFINALKDELKQKVENEKIIKGNVDDANAELKKLRKTAKKAPDVDQDNNIDYDKLYSDLKEVTLDNLDKNQNLATNKKDVKELEVKIMLIEDEINILKKSCQEIQDVFKVPMKEYPVLKVDESELERLRKELRDKQQELRDLEQQKADLNTKIADSEREYKNIKIYRSQRFTIREEGQDDDYQEENKFLSPGPASFGAGPFNSSIPGSPKRVEASPSELRKSRLSQSPAITRDVENVMKEVYYGRPGPKIRKTEDGTFIYGTREFVVTKEKGKLYARDFEADDKQKMELEEYLKKHEVTERQTALKTNLQYLNDDIGSEDEEMAEVGEEHEVHHDPKKYNIK